MINMNNHRNLELLKPDIERDAPFALSWFVRPEGKDTLLRMGNAEHEIPEPSLICSAVHTLRL